jgi:methionine--tRNA ligase beta chain
MINIDDFKKIEMAVGKILSAEKIPDTDKLIKLSVDFGEEKPRQIISGIAEFFQNLEDLVDKKCMFVINLEPRSIKGYESNGMIMALSSPQGDFSLIIPENDITVGLKAK